jgi:hypothetical protein
VASFNFNDIYLRLRGNFGTSATFTDFRYGDNHGQAPTDKNQCKNGGWTNFVVPHLFKNQGDCIQYINTGK